MIVDDFKKLEIVELYETKEFLCGCCDDVGKDIDCFSCPIEKIIDDVATRLFKLDIIT